MENQMVTSVSQTFEKGLATIRKKNHDYATDEDMYRNFTRCECLGIPPSLAIMIRIEDKISRIENLLLKERYVTEETIDDTILDAVNYLAILKARLEFERQEAIDQQETRNQRIKGDHTEAPRKETYITAPAGASINIYDFNALTDKKCPVCKKEVEPFNKWLIVHASVYHEVCFYERKR